MTNQRLYTNKAMAIGAVIDALDCDLNDLTDVYMLTQNRLVDAGILIPDYPATDLGDFDHDDDDDSTPEDHYAEMTTFVAELD